MVTEVTEEIPFTLPILFKEMKKLAFSAGALLKKTNSVITEPDKVAEPDKPNAAPGQYGPVETLSVAEGWKQIIDAGKVEGAFFLEVLAPMQYTWGPRVIVTDRDREELRQQFPGLMIFTPPEFMQIIRDWPGSEATVRALHQFGGELAGGAEGERLNGLH